ncbi:hypothetical protein V6N13_016150 [Hibiscus sabdariffa]|uniref:Uncharacterized protein n=2 Tax=Hibiscus sabdariffa TaxID=183260 RepID=A0ABR2NEK1_9ROSI
MVELGQKLVKAPRLAKALEGRKGDAKAISIANIRVVVASNEAEVTRVEAHRERKMVSKNVEEAQKVRVKLDAFYVNASQL